MLSGQLGSSMGNFFQPPSVGKSEGGIERSQGPKSSPTLLSRKKWLKYGEYAGGFKHFNRDKEIDPEDEVDLAIKDLKSEGQYGTNRGDGFGHIGKGSEDMDVPLVKFHKLGG